jgi:chorismate synthase
VYCDDLDAEKDMIAGIDAARNAGDTLGGVIEVLAWGLPVGLGSHVHWDRRLDGRLAQAVMSIPGIKGVEIGLGFQAAAQLGSTVHDEIFFNAERGFYRETNRAGGIEGGVTNGEPLVLRAAMKPIPTLAKPLKSIDIRTKQPSEASYERSDICAVPAAAVVAEGMVAFVLAQSVLEKFAKDSLAELLESLANYNRYLRSV